MMPFPVLSSFRVIENSGRAYSDFPLNTMSFSALPKSGTNFMAHPAVNTAILFFSPWEYCSGTKSSTNMLSEMVFSRWPPQKKKGGYFTKHVCLETAHGERRNGPVDSNNVISDKFLAVLDVFRVDDISPAMYGIANLSRSSVHSDAGNVWWTPFERRKAVK